MSDDLTWVSDNHGNRCSIKYYGSFAAAQEALDSLVRCVNCENCENCTDCKDCSICESCNNCLGCLRCFRCWHCSACSDCSDYTHRKHCSHGMGLEIKNQTQPASLKIPIIPHIHQRIYEAASRPGALCMDDWHSCKTTHCRAGWVIELAGREGRALERFYRDTSFAAQQIYRTSSPLHVPSARFYDSEEDALADMKRLADLERAMEFEQTMKLFDPFM